MTSNVITLNSIAGFIISNKDSVVLGKNDIFDMIEACGELISDYIHNEPLSFSRPDFHDTLKQACFELLTFQLNNVNVVNMTDQLDKIIERAHKIHFTRINPLRSYAYTFIRKVPDISKMRDKIEYLRNTPQPEQRTTAWYEYRYNLITASNAWKALDSPSSVNSLIYEKCKPLDLRKHDGLNTETPFHWGQKYEPLSVMIYEDKYKTVVEDFGCIQCQDHKFLGASPDGINVDNTSSVYGRMLEVKNIFNREINGVPKRDYWCQMQIQMGVCKLNECDFLETRFIEYDDEEAFDKDGTFQLTENNEMKGVILYFVKNAKAIYEYAPLHLSKKEFNDWEEKMMDEHSDKMWVKNLYWRLDQLSCVLVLYNKVWFNAAVKIFEKTWKIIEYERIHGYEHRAPNKRDKKSSSIELATTTGLSKCLINTTKILQLQDINDSDINNDDIIIDNNEVKSVDMTPVDMTSVDMTSADMTPVVKIRSLSLDETKLNT
jgi:putative phage-type endonuclease